MPSRKQTTAPRTRKPGISDAQKAAEKANRNLTFIRLGEPRLARARKYILSIRNLATYPHSEKQAEKIMAVLNEAVQAVSFSFAAKEETVAAGVSLRD